MNKLLLAGLCAASCAVAQARDFSASVDVVQGQVAGTAYQNGGIGRDEVAQMARQRAGYDLNLSFSQGRQNAYVADAQLDVLNAAGQRVLHLAHAGPLTDLALPAGRYSVQARFGTVEQTARVDVRPDHPTPVALHWSRDAG